MGDCRHGIWRLASCRVQLVEWSAWPRSLDDGGGRLHCIGGRLDDLNGFPVAFVSCAGDRLIMRVIRHPPTLREVVHGESGRKEVSVKVYVVETYATTYCSSSCRSSGFIFSRSGWALRFVWVSGFSTIKNSSSSCDTSKLALLSCDGACQCSR